MNRNRPSLQQLIDYRLDTLESSDREAIRAALQSGDPALTKQMARVERMFAALPQSAGERVGEAARERVHAAFRQRFQAPTRPPLLARLVFDSRLTLAASGARDAGDGTIQALYSTATHDLYLWQEARPDGEWYLIGQALPREDGPPPLPRSATLTRTDGQAIPIVQDETEFHARGTQPGVYTLRLRIGEEDIVVDDYKIGAVN